MFETLQAIITTIVLSYLQQSLKEMLLLHYERLAHMTPERDTRTRYEHPDRALRGEMINDRPFASDPPSSNQSGNDPSNDSSYSIHSRNEIAKAAIQHHHPSRTDPRHFQIKGSSDHRHRRYETELHPSLHRFAISSVSAPIPRDWRTHWRTPST